jgi:hypothetical protein
VVHKGIIQQMVELSTFLIMLSLVEHACTSGMVVVVVVVAVIPSYNFSELVLVGALLARSVKIGDLNSAVNWAKFKEAERDHSFYYL